MPNTHVPESPEREDDLDYSWGSVKASATDLSRKSKLLLKNLPGELADAADDYICTKAEAVKESLVGRINRTRDRVKRRLVLRAIRSIDFTMRIVFFRVLKLKLDRLRQKFEKLNEENDLEQLRCEIGKRMVGFHQTSDGCAKTDPSFQG
jgi:hypothetical protein